MPLASIDQYREQVDLLPNLQLLGGTPNIEKQAKFPNVWLEGAFATPEQRATYERENDLDGLAALDPGSFTEFFEARRERIRNRLENALHTD